MAFNFNTGNKIILVLLVLLSAVLYGHALMYAEVSLDAGYYLGLAQQVLNGELLYKELINNYTPLAIYYFAAIMAIFGDGYPVMLLSQFFILFLSAYLLYLCADRITGNRILSLVFAFTYLLVSYCYDSSYIYLEPFVNLCGILSVYFLIRWEKEEHGYLLFFAGISSCLAFLCKQYGILYVGFVGLFVLSKFLTHGIFSFRMALWQLITLLSGIMLPLFSLLIVYAFLGIKPSDFITSLIIKAYADESVSNYYQATGSFLLFNGLGIILLPRLLLAKEKQISRSNLFLFLFLLLLFTTPFYVKIFPHYAMLTLPATFLLLAAIYSGMSILKSLGLKMLFYLCLYLTIGLNAYRAIENFQHNDGLWNRAVQLNTAREINKRLPQGSQVLVLSDYHYYYLCRFKPVLPREFGFSFASSATTFQLNGILSKTRFCLVHKDRKDKYFKDEAGQIYEVPNSDFLIVKLK